MHHIYDFVSGPLVWLSFIIFISGSIYRIATMAMLAKKKDGVVYDYMDSFYALRSIMHWIIPFGSENMKKHPAMTIVTFVFHISLVIAPLFLFAHIALIKEAWDISWGYISDTTADIMTILVIASCVFFMLRRIKLPEVRYLTDTSDYILLAIVAAPFVTGFLAYHQWMGYKLMVILHILSGEVMLAAIPFTRLSHVLFFPFTRGYIGSEFGAVRHAKDW
ncbi:MAG: nitrate reductase [Desulfobacteraceae bacterium IS3]|nr:MAG: nitrate reductase [Desulfobacteraceae bacterium IS3]HAO22381.1 nitrate reductase [Desulfobacteraceae bacterium]